MAQPARAVLQRLGRRIGELREGRGLTQERLAEKLDVSTVYLQRVERGVENLTIVSLLKIASALRVELRDLLSAPASRTRRGPGRPKRTE